MKTADLIRRYFAVYQARDRVAAETMLSADFTFSSPLDDHIDKAAYFERCWPNGDHQGTFTLERIFCEGDEGFVTYCGARADGARFRNTEFFRTAGDQITQVVVYFGSDTPAGSGEEELRQLMEEVAAGIRAMDAEAMVRRYAEDVTAFDLIEPLQYQGRAEVKRRAEEWLGSWDGEIGFEMRDLVIRPGADTAFCHSLHRVKGIKQDGQAVEMGWRATHCCQKHDGQWWITHIHSSVPFDMNTGQASLTLASGE